MQAAEEQGTSGAAALVMSVHSSQIVKQSRQPVRQSGESLYNMRTCAARTRGYKSSLHSHAGGAVYKPNHGRRIFPQHLHTHTGNLINLAEEKAVDKLPWDSPGGLKVLCSPYGALTGAGTL